VFTFQPWLYYFNKGWLRWWLVLIYTLIALVLIGAYLDTLNRHHVRSMRKLSNSIMFKISGVNSGATHRTVTAFKNKPQYVEAAQLPENSNKTAE
jgi:hypothetical protein